MSFLERALALVWPEIIILISELVCDGSGAR